MANYCCDIFPLIRTPELRQAIWSRWWVAIVLMHGVARVPDITPVSATDLSIGQLVSLAFLILIKEQTIKNV